MASLIPKTADLIAQGIKLARPKISTFLYFAKYELIPPKPSEIPEIGRGIARILGGYKNGTWKQLTVKQSFLNTLVAMEVVCWFYIGECIGKRHLVGYKLG